MTNLNKYYKDVFLGGLATPIEVFKSMLNVEEHPLKMNKGRCFARDARTNGLEAIANNHNMGLAEKINETYSFAKGITFVYATGLGISISGICAIPYVLINYL